MSVASSASSAVSTLYKIEERSGRSQAEGRCTICMNDFSGRERIWVHRQCRSTFHKDCLEEWLNDRCTCPHCRACLHKIHDLDRSEPCDARQAHHAHDPDTASEIRRLAGGYDRSHSGRSVAGSQASRVSNVVVGPIVNRGNYNTIDVEPGRDLADQLEAYHISASQGPRSVVSRSGSRAGRVPSEASTIRPGHAGSVVSPASRRRGSDSTLGPDDSNSQAGGRAPSVASRAPSHVSRSGRSTTSHAGQASRHELYTAEGQLDRMKAARQRVCQNIDQLDAEQARTRFQSREFNELQTQLEREHRNAAELWEEIEDAKSRVEEVRSQIGGDHNALVLAGGSGRSVAGSRAGSVLSRASSLGTPSHAGSRAPSHVSSRSQRRGSIESGVTEATLRMSDRIPHGSQLSVRSGASQASHARSSASRGGSVAGSNLTTDDRVRMYAGSDAASVVSRAPSTLSRTGSQASRAPSQLSRASGQTSSTIRLDDPTRAIAHSHRRTHNHRSRGENEDGTVYITQETMERTTYVVRPSGRR